MQKYDIIFIGAGPAGYSGAIKASKAGLKTLVFDKKKIGGVCLNEGCIPSKTLIQQTELIKNVQKLKRIGINCETQFNYKKINQFVKRKVKSLTRGIENSFKKYDVEFINEKIEFTDKYKIKTESGNLYESKNIIIATGSEPCIIEGLNFSDKILNSSDALFLNELPKKMVIIGGGIIGIETASIFSGLGVEITILENKKTILSEIDEDSVNLLKKNFKRNKIKIFENINSLKVNEKKEYVDIDFRFKNKKKSIKTEKALICIGRKPVTKDLKLENAGVEKDRFGFIKIKDYYETNIKNVFAVGDVINSPMLAHTAIKETEIAVDYILKNNPDSCLKLDEIPNCIYSEPEIASFGLKKNKNKVKQITVPYTAVGKAVVSDWFGGQVKLFVDKKDFIVGADIVGHNATELIHQLLIAKKFKIKTDEFRKMIFAHPTLSEVILESLNSVHGDSLI